MNVLRRAAFDGHRGLLRRPNRAFRCSPPTARDGLASPSASPPLRILFCGSDLFSIYSLDALHRLRSERPDLVADIDVVCRPDKRVGSKLKQIRAVPIKARATELGLALHQLDTFTGWTPPAPIDLVVAVSFGLLVPSRILSLSRHGGLNVHPSLLPDLRGPAPLQHALLQARASTGVTLQTMHPHRFDHGAVLAQSPSWPIPAGSTYESLVRELGPLGAQLLADGLVARLHESPVSTLSAHSGSASHAPKITPEDRRIDWTSWPADRVVRYGHVLEKLWDAVSYRRCVADEGAAKRLIFHGPWLTWDHVPVPDHVVPGTPVVADALRSGEAGPRLAFWTVDRKLVSPADVTIEGGRRADGVRELVKALGAAPQ